MRRFVTSVPALAVLLACTLALVAAPRLLDRLAAAHTSARVTLARQVLSEDDILLRIDRALTALAEASMPGVVHVDVRGGGPGLSSGSGWVFDTGGHIVTNAHVVRGESNVRVQFANGRTEQAKLVGIDAFTDIAVLKIDPFPGIIALPRAEEELVRQGQRVYAFGSPFGFKHSMSEGIVSGLGRDPSNASEFGGFTNFIQTDAAVNPGNSGGPLVDARGRIVGMNVAIATGRETDGTTEGDSAGISFAIPVATIESVVPQLIRSGSVSRGFLGLRFEPRPAGERTPDGDYVSGIRVSSVVVGGPSDRAGLREADLVVRIANQAVPRFNLLRSIVGGAEPGTAVPIDVYRDGRILQLEVVLGEMPDNVLAQVTESASRYRLGVEFGDGQGDDESAPVVSQVFPGLPAFDAGLRPGDRILSVGGKPVESASQVFIELNNAGVMLGSRAQIVVDGEEGRRTLTLSLNR